VPSSYVGARAAQLNRQAVLNMHEERSIRPGDRLLLSGGYEMAPRWLCGRPSHIGTVIDLVPGQSDQSAVLLKLDAPIEVDGLSGEFLVLETRYVGQAWTDKGTVHLELCNFEPERKRWQDRRQGKWVESHAMYQRT
jgi:hypothetical protein